MERTDVKNDVKIGIIGKGFVGSAVAHGFSHQTSYGANIKIYDVNPERSQNTLDETVNDSDFIFLSVPTPSDSAGNMDLSIVDNALDEINKVNKNSSNIVLLRSTVVPGTTKIFQEKFPNLRFVFNPEFLTERSAAFDFINQTRVILGGKIEYTSLSCVIINIHCLYGLKYFIISINSIFNSLSNALVGSSKTKILEGLINPLIILATCRCPPDKFSPE